MVYSATVPLPDEDATTRLGSAVAPCLRSGDVILLEGQIGAGKTHFARAVIQSRLAAEDRAPIDIPSPTYTLVQTYEAANAEIWHADLYRLSDMSEVAELGLEDAFASAIVLVEWPDRLDDPPQSALTLLFRVVGDGRVAEFRFSSERWKPLVDQFAHA